MEGELSGGESGIRAPLAPAKPVRRCLDDQSSRQPNEPKVKKLAERVGFEPTVEFPLHTLSKRAPSTTRTSLRLSGINSLPEGGEPCKSKL